MFADIVGRGFSALPLLTSAATSIKPHPPLPDHTPYHRDIAQGLGKVDELHRDRERSPSLSTSFSNVTDGCPEDALFPPKRGGAATLFLGDCLNTKVKPKQDQTQASNHWPHPLNHTHQRIFCVQWENSGIKNNWRTGNEESLRCDVIKLAFQSSCCSSFVSFLWCAKRNQHSMSYSIVTHTNAQCIVMYVPAHVD